MITADEIHSNLIPLPPSPHNFTTQQKRGLRFGAQDKKSGLGAMPDGTEREAKRGRAKTGQTKICY